MKIEEYKKKYSHLSNAEVRKLSEKSHEFKAETEALYMKAYGTKLNKSCGECWVEAYVMLMRLDKEKFHALETKRFDLKAGALLIDRVNGDNAKMCTRINLTDDLALYHLKTNPGCADQFSKMPDNWKELVEQYGEEKNSDAENKDPESDKMGTTEVDETGSETDTTDDENSQSEESAIGNQESKVDEGKERESSGQGEVQSEAETPAEHEVETKKKSSKAKK